MNNIPITVGDQHLINQALKVPYTDWEIVDGMIDQARSDEAKEELRAIRNRLIHKEEYYGGIL